MVQTTGGFERTCTPSEAFSRAESFSKNRLNITPEFSCHGKDLHSVVCKLRHKDKEIIGIGKGLGIQSNVSSLLEAVEHLVWGDSLPETPPIALDLKVNDVKLRNISPDFELICHHEQVAFSRVLFKDMVNGSELSFPYFLTNPFWKPVHPTEKSSINRFSLMRYSTNSGTAAGSTEEEAILHALLESIERDAIGMELLKSIYKKPALPVRSINANTLPISISATLEKLGLDDAHLLKSWDISSELNIPVLLVCIYDSITKRKYFGSGCSLLPVYAFERALLEAVQSMHMWRTQTKIPKQFEINEDTPLFVRSSLDTGYFGYKGGETLINFGEISYPDLDFTTITIKEQLSFLTGAIAGIGYRAYFRTLMSSEISVAQVVIPEFERFYLVSSRIPVMPSKRGRDLLTNSI